MMLAKLAKIALEFKKLETQMSDPVIIADQKRYKQTGQRYQELKPIVQLYEQYQALAGDLNSALELQQESADPELAAEVNQLQEKQAALLKENQQKQAAATQPAQQQGARYHRTGPDRHGGGPDGQGIQHEGPGV